MKTLLTQEANRLQDLISTHLEMARKPAIKAVFTVKTDTDHIIFESINESAIVTFRKQGKNPYEPVFTTGWLTEKQEGKDVVIPHVLMSDDEMAVPRSSQGCSGKSEQKIPTDRQHRQ